MGQQSLKLLFTGNSLNDSKKGINTMAKKDTYDAGSISVLEGLEAVRKRPGMYIGSVSRKGLNHLIYEIVDNSVDEHLAGACSQIRVTLEADGSCTVRDNGRGIPVEMHKKGVSAERVVLSTLHAGGKFDNFNSKQQKAIHELIDGLTEIPTKPNKDQYRVDNQSQYTKIVGRTYYNGEYALYAIQKGKTMYASIACPAIGPDISIDNIKEGFKLSLKEGKRAVWTKVK